MFRSKASFSSLSIIQKEVPQLNLKNSEINIKNVKWQCNLEIALNKTLNTSWRIQVTNKN